MAFLIHFVFSIFKIAVLASIYALMIALAFRLLSQKFISIRKVWFTSGSIISFCLFINMFTHWGDHGLGDSARVPLKQGREVNQIDGYWTFITPKGYEYEVLTLSQFSFTDNYLIGQVDEPKIGKYAVWDLKSNEVKFVDDLMSYHYLDIELKDFYYHYRNYWGGWRFWLLV